MNLGDYLIWEATNGLLLIPVVIGLVMLARRLRGKPAFTERDWLFLFGHSRKKVFSPRLLLRFAAMLVLVVVVGLGLSFLRVAVWVRMVCGCGSYHHRKPPVCCTEVATLRAIDKVSPGPDLDALIAEDVFGWGNVPMR